MPRGRNRQTGELTTAVAAILSDAFLDLFITQTQFGVLTGISQSMVSLFFRGERSPDLDQLDRMCKALGLDVSLVVSQASASRSTADS
ncbi:helix-turn-helix transcriptional regulator [Subtercola sp. RTI3]|uniref:helix-turn-helix domain-containing protein n=1 Tax=Subtercola sp. RTI3 TaxID=3048639 RepID=UPI002B23469D|nr:helix-turn-helix transcriptional regulator [Subtercola sp. RTI3]MEA9983698.1 helix-turn-helix transcriptional regulator [Subtercola sp. RTI3]